MKKQIVVLMVMIAISITGFQAVADATFPSASNTLKGYDWPMARYDIENTAFSPSSAPDDNTVAWNMMLLPQIRSSPAIVDDVAYIGAGSKLFCFDALTGGEYWNFSTGNIIWSSPTVVDDAVYFGSFDGKFYCLNALTGVELWNFSAGALILSSPVVSNGRVYFGSGDYTFYCLDASDGTLLWYYTTGSTIYTSPACDGEQIYFGSSDRNFYCLDAETGDFKWDFSAGISLLFSTPSVYEENVYFGTSQGKVFCVNKYDGSEQWNHSNGGASITSSLAIAYGNVYVYTAHDPQGGDNFYCLEAVAGELLWEHSFGGSTLSSPVVADGKVYVGSDYDGYLYCRNADDGTPLWNYSTEMGITCSAVVANGRVYIGNNEGLFFCFGATNQAPTTPLFFGPVAGGVSIELNFTVVAEDADGEQVSYMIDWGDGNMTEWLGPYNESVNVTVPYYWMEEGNYEVKVKAKDTSEQESDWSEPSLVSIGDQIEISNIQSGFVYLRMLSFNRSFAYVYILDTLGVSVIIGNDLLDVVAEATEPVTTVKFELYNLIWDELTEGEDDNSSNGFTTQLITSSGLMQLTAYAYDDNGQMIDYETIDYVIFIGFGGQSLQSAGMRTSLRHRITHTIL